MHSKKASLMCVLSSPSGPIAHSICITFVPRGAFGLNVISGSLYCSQSIIVWGWDTDLRGFGLPCDTCESSAPRHSSKASYRPSDGGVQRGPFITQTWPPVAFWKVLLPSGWPIKTFFTAGKQPVLRSARKRRRGEGWCMPMKVCYSWQQPCRGNTRLLFFFCREWAFNHHRWNFSPSVHFLNSSFIFWRFHFVSLPLIGWVYSLR